MKPKMKKCKSCGEYTLTDKCPCGGEVGVIYPPKYSPEDKYGKYRRMLKEQLSKS
ncbi:Ribosome biogenesis protein Nop10 [Methanobacterium lacus]|jgi:H/ACA ribonucleoprotein complex subunit 3|uniref:Ribosome biogenesis protein Nop10 n=1 Tax=Methanobacterium lacus (strain AL-21) TaxID=877455 RepID=F0T7X5_METLA|nr:RNA-protein complex protein Nop10 [Methanobacterium lacus]ADZ08462.1 Ribosome biogenesis protein Nop10 [Methanobacterium lacus]